MCDISELVIRHQDGEEVSMLKVFSMMAYKANTKECFFKIYSWNMIIFKEGSINVSKFHWTYVYHVD